MWTSRASGRPSTASRTAWKAAGVARAALEAQAQPEALEEARQVVDARRDRAARARDAGRDAPPHQLAGDRLVGGQHALLDEAVRDVALGAHDLLGPAAQVEQDLGLGQVEVDGAARAPAGEQRGGQALRVLERLEQASRALARTPASRSTSAWRHLGVGEARGAAHHGVVELGRARPPARRRSRAAPPAPAGPRRRVRLQRSFDSASGSIGTTRSGK